jgi:hypothetical protein
LTKKYFIAEILKSINVLLNKRMCKHCMGMCVAYYGSSKVDPFFKKTTHNIDTNYMFVLTPSHLRDLFHIADGASTVSMTLSQLNKYKYFIFNHVFVLSQRVGKDHVPCTINWVDIYFTVKKSLKICLNVTENKQVNIW